MRLVLTLPYPPSVNHYWRTTVVRKGRRHVPRVYVSEEGKRYRRRVVAILKDVPQLSGPVGATIVAYPPDNRRRDLDNLPKSLLDALTWAGVWEDDSALVYLAVLWGPELGGNVKVMVEQVGDGPVATVMGIARWLRGTFRAIIGTE